MPSDPKNVGQKRNEYLLLLYGIISTLVNKWNLRHRKIFWLTSMRLIQPVYRHTLSFCTES